jgi:pimeloyl-ACP methyl ester carboxylesterase
MRRYVQVLYGLGLSFFGILSSNAQLLAQEIKPSWPIPSGIKWEAVNGYPMAYRDTGSGTPIILVHGSTNDYRVWDPQFNVFDGTHRVIAVSLRHFYPERWDGVGTDFSIEQHAQDVAALIKKLSLGKVHLVGHSRGGAVVIEVAKSHPEVIRTLVLPDASIEMPVPDTAEAKEAAEWNKKLIGTLQTNLKIGDPVKAAEVFIDTVTGPGTWANWPETKKERLLANIYTAMGDKGRPLTSCDDVKKFDFPVLLMTGDRSPKKFEFMYGEMRKCKNDLPQTVVIPNAGHGMQSDNAEAFNKSTLVFVSQH